MDSNKALTKVVSSLHQRAELRIEVARDWDCMIVEAASLITESLGFDKAILAQFNT